MLRRDCLSLMLGGSLAALPLPSRASGSRALRMVLTTAPTSLDPHYHDSFTSTQALLQIYSQLRVQDSTGAVVPGIAKECRPVSDTVWELELRQGVRFHDGTPFEAEDIAFSFERVANLANPLSSFIANVRDVKRVEVLSPERVRIELKSPDPLYEYKLTQICMLSRRIHADATTRDFTSGRFAIGTGSYKLRSFNVGTELVLDANPDFYGGRPEWESVHIRYVSEAGARIAALSTGEADLMDNVPVQDIARLSSNPQLALFSSPGLMMVYLAPDTVRDQTPFIFDNNGQPLPRNPLKDPRVRRALSLSLNREAIVSRLLAGQGRVPDQMVGPTVRDRAPGMTPLAYDPDQAKRLLAEAGYPDGFRMTIHGPAGQFNNDDSLLQAYAQSFTRINIRTQVETMPAATFATRSASNAFSLFHIFFNGPFALVTLRFLAMTPDRERGNGSSNRQAYSNPRIDTLMREALVTMNLERRIALTSEAMREWMTDAGVIPVFNATLNWAGRKDRVHYEANPMARTSAFMARPVG